MQQCMRTEDHVSFGVMMNSSFGLLLFAPIISSCYSTPTLVTCSCSCALPVIGGLHSLAGWVPPRRRHLAAVALAITATKP